MSASFKLNRLREEERLLSSLLDKVKQQLNCLQTEELAIISQLKASGGFALISQPVDEEELRAQEVVVSTDSTVALNLEVGEVLKNLAHGGEQIAADIEEEEEDE